MTYIQQRIPEIRELTIEEVNKALRIIDANARRLPRSLSSTSSTATRTVTTITVTTTINSTYDIVLCNGALTVHLPTIAGDEGREFTIINIGAGTVTINPFLTETINGAATFALTTTYTAVTILATATEWVIL